MLAEEVRTEPIVNPITGTVQTSATQILRNNPNRVMALFVNNSANDGFFGFDRQVSSSRGVRLSNSGGSATLTWEEDRHLVKYAVWAINLALVGIWYVVEVVEI